MKLAASNSICARAAAVVLLLLAMEATVAAGTHRGDALIARARQAEAKDTTADMDTALNLAQQALALDPSDVGYQLDVARLRTFAAQYHVYDGQVLRDQGKLSESIAEFDKAAKLDPASSVALQEAARTRAVVKKIENNPDAKPEELRERPAVIANREANKLLATATSVPRLKTDLDKPIPVIKVNNQLSAEVFRAFAKATGLRIFFDPDYIPRPLGLNQTLDFHSLTLEQALDYLSVVTRSFWKPLASDTIFVSLDDPARRSLFEDQVTKAFYLTNAASAQTVADIAATVQKVTDIKKIFVHPEQNVIVARADPDRLALAEKIIADLDKPKAEIIVDVLILSVTKNWSRNLGVMAGISGNSLSTTFAPRPANSGIAGSSAAGIAAPAPSPTAAPSVPLNRLANLGAADFALTLPGQSLNALLEISGTKVLDKAQIRTVEGHVSTLHIGEKVPYATGSFAPGASGNGVSAIVNTQFQFFDIGLNIDVLAKVHEPDEVSLHIESDTSTVLDRVDLGGVLQPEISQRKRVADVRVKEGEVNIYDIVTERQDTRSSSGLPGLSQIPLLGRLFSSETIQKNEVQVVTLLIPHIIRAPDIRQVNLAAVPSGSDLVVRMRYDTDTAAPGGPAVADLELPPGPPPAPTPAPGFPMVGMPGVQPGMYAPGMPQPGMPQAGVPGMPGFAQPGVPQPGMPQPGMPQIGMPQPGVPGMPQSAAPGMPTPGVPPTVAGVPGIPAAPAANPRLAFSPPATRAAANSTFTVTLTLNDAPDIKSGTINLLYDVAALKLVNVDGGTLLAKDGQKFDGVPLVLQLAPIAGGGRNTSGPVATLTFRAVAVGSTSVGILGATLTDTRGQTIPLAGDPLSVEIK